MHKQFCTLLTLAQSDSNAIKKPTPLSDVIAKSFWRATSLQRNRVPCIFNHLAAAVLYLVKINLPLSKHLAAANVAMREKIERRRGLIKICAASHHRPRANTQESCWLGSALTLSIWREAFYLRQFSAR
jgi:hypothetical protein